MMIGQYVSILGSSLSDFGLSVLTYRDLDGSIDNLWGILYATGYLTGTRGADNIYTLIQRESAFSSTNAQDDSYPGLNNPEYNYRIHDKVGYGLIQWTYFTRKEGLKNKADEMNTIVGDVGTQLAYFRDETKGICNSEWRKVLNSASLDEATTKFAIDFEGAGKPALSERKKFAKLIYRMMKNL